MPEASHFSTPSLYEVTKVYFKVGVLSFGGPAAQIALMHKIFVDEEKWISEKQYLNALSFCMLLPGPEAMQLATYIGWRLQGRIGGLLAGFLFVLPGAFAILCLAILYAYFGNTNWMEATFLGIKATVLVVVIEVLLRISKKALSEKNHWMIAGLSFLGIFLFELPYPLIIIMASLFGFVYARQNADSEASWVASVSTYQTLKTIALWLVVWIVPLVTIGWGTGWGFLYDLGIFFSKLSTVAFGGAYAVLAYMSQEVVFDLKWLTTVQMMDGLGLAETTPAPLILVTEFVGFIAGFQEGGLPIAVIAAVIVLWVTFVPCFLWIFVGAPYIEWIVAQPRLKNALSSITAAVVGGILSLSLWCGLHVFFSEVHKEKFGFIRVWQPDIDSMNILVLIISCLSYYLLIVRHTSMLYVLGICALLGIFISLFM